MKIFLAIVGFIIGNLLGLVILALFATSTSSGMEHSFIIGTIFGIIGAICGYIFQKRKVICNYTITSLSPSKNYND